jgi:hypothetical protein
MADISISIKAGDLSGLDAITRQIDAMKRRLGATGGQAQSGISLPLNIRPGDTSGIDALHRAMGRAFETLPGGGIRRVGYTGSTGTGTYAPPSLAGSGAGGLPPRPPGAPPFGTFALPPPGPPRPGSPAWLAAQGYTVAPAGGPSGGEGLPAAGTPFATAGRWALGQAGNALHGAQGVARAALGVGAGISVYQTLTESMRIYQERARGVLDIGARLNQQFDDTDESIKQLGERYKILPHDVITGFETLSRYTGRLRGGEDAASYAQAYRVPFAQAAALSGPLQQLTRSGGDPFARLLASLGPSRPGLPDLPARIEEATRVAGAGGSGMPLLPSEFAGRFTNLIQNMGSRYTLPGAASAMAGQMLEGMTQSPNDVVQGIRMQAISRVAERRRARGQSTTLDIGGVPTDIGTIWGHMVAASGAPGHPEILGAYEEAAQRISHGRPDLLRMAQSQIVLGGKLNPYEVEQAYRSSGMPATGFAGLGRPASAATEQAAADMEKQRQALQARPEFAPERVLVDWQKVLVPLGKSMVDLSNEMKNAFTTAAQDGVPTMKSLEAAFKGMGDTAKVLLGTLIALSSQGTLGQLAGLGIAAGGMGNMIRDAYAERDRHYGLIVPGMEQFQQDQAARRNGPSLLPQQLGP